MFGLLGFILALFSLACSLFILVSIRLYMSKLKPVVSRAMSIVGKMGKDTQVENALFEEAEVGLKEGFMQILYNKYPEAALVIGWLEENKPDLYEKLMEHPETIVALYNKYAPMILNLVGKRTENKQSYEL